MQEVTAAEEPKEFDGHGNRIRFRLYHNGGEPVVLNGRLGERRAFKKERAACKAEKKKVLGRLRRRDGKRLDVAEFRKRAISRAAVSRAAVSRAAVNAAAAEAKEQS